MANTSTWNVPDLNYRNSNQSSFSQPGMNNAGGGNMLSTPLGRVHTSTAPPIPPRPVRHSSSYFSPQNNYMYGGYSSGLSGYGGYGSYNGYNGYGGYGFNSFRPSYGYMNSSYPENRFIQLAEESSRPAFQSIQSVLQMFSSVTMMFESSFHAIYSSYMSVLGVADNFAKLRNAFGQIFSTLAVIRAFNWIYKRLLHILGLSNENFTKESIWTDAMREVSTLNLENSKKNKRKTWPLLVFMSIIIGGPYLLFKLISELQPHPVQEIWLPAEQPGPLAIGLYDFYAASDQELSVTSQQKLMIAPKKFQPLDCPGWLLACNESRKTGLVPKNYIGFLKQSEKTGQTYIEYNGQTYQPVTNLSEPVQKAEEKKTEEES